MAGEQAGVCVGLAGCARGAIVVVGVGEGARSGVEVGECGEVAGGVGECAEGAAGAARVGADTGEVVGVLWEGGGLGSR